MIHMKHTCKGAILHCIDFRLGPSIKAWLEKEGLLGDCDIISVAGAAKNMDVPVAQLELSHKLHETSVIILMNHTDCGAYGGRAAFESNEDETETHFQAMKEAKELLMEKFPDIQVRTVLARIAENGEISFEERS